MSLFPGRPSLLLWDTHVADSDHSCDWNAHCLTNRYLEEDGLRPPAALDYVSCINYGIFLGGVGIWGQGHFSYFCNYWGWNGRSGLEGVINLFGATLKCLSHWALSLAGGRDQASYAGIFFCGCPVPSVD